MTEQERKDRTAARLVDLYAGRGDGGRAKYWAEKANWAVKVRYWSHRPKDVRPEDMR